MSKPLQVRLLARLLPEAGIHGCELGLGFDAFKLRNLRLSWSADFFSFVEIRQWQSLAAVGVRRSDLEMFASETKVETKGGQRLGGVNGNISLRNKISRNQLSKKQLRVPTGEFVDRNMD